jgi:hypothetical protein
MRRGKGDILHSARNLKWAQRDVTGIAELVEPIGISSLHSREIP